MTKHVLNGTNLHVGGGVQVAASLVSEIIGKYWTDRTLDAFLSSEVIQNLPGPSVFSAKAVQIENIDVSGFNFFNTTMRRRLRGFDAVFTIFGPLYRWNPPFKSIVGFAQPWIIYPDNEVYSRMAPLSRLKSRLKYWVQGKFFKRADLLVVELEHVKEGLVRHLGIDPARIHVINNCLSAIYHTSDLWQDTSIPECKCDLRLGFIGRNYSHKNTQIFPEIVRLLKLRHGIEAKFYVTFTEDEWRSCSIAFRAACINVGPLKVTQCPSFYKSVDAVVFPSLLECFSATPLEAMAMKKPLFASDRRFNRDVCSSYANYFDPLSAASAADAIGLYFRSGRLDEIALKTAQEHALCFSSAEERADKYLALLRQVSGLTDS